ncbi:MAG: YfhO family protein [bacterium]|nr:YfhO family protein [bacterium]
MRNRPAPLIALFLLALPYVLLSPAVFGTEAILFPDHLSFFYPFKYAAARMYREGRIALWNPYIFAGLPAGAEIQTALFYPLNIFFLPLPVFRAIAHFAAFHLFLASLFMYLFLRGIGISRRSSLFGSCVFAYNGFSIVHTEQLSIISTCAWLPLLLLLLQRASERRGILYPTLAGLALGLQFLAGHPQMALINMLTLGAYAVFLLWGPMRAGDRAEARRRARVSVAIAALGLSLASIALIPFAEAYRHSLRAHAGAAGPARVALAPGRLHTMLLPGLRPEEGALAEVTGGVYVGAIPFLLALLAVVTMRRGVAAFLAILAGLSILAALGGATPVYRLLHAVPPLRPALQLPIRLLFPSMLALSALSSIALDRFAGETPGIPSPPRWAWIILVVPLSLFVMALAGPSGGAPSPHATAGVIRATCRFLALLGAGLLLLSLRARGRIGARAIAPVLLILTLADLLSFGRGYLRFGDAAAAGAKPPVFDFFERDDGLYRVSIFDREIGLNLPMVYGIQGISGYSPIILMDTLRYAIFSATRSHDLSAVHPMSRFYLLPDVDTKMSGLLNVKYHVSPFTSDGVPMMRVSRREHFYPRAFIIPRHAVMPERSRILEMLADEAFDPAATVMLETDAGLEGFEFSAGTRGSARVERFSRDRIDVVTSADGDAFLFVSEIFFPGWRVSVDGAGGTIYRAHYLFRAVPLRRGEHRVSFIYDPASFRAGLYLTIGSLALALFLLLLGLPAAARRRGGPAGR